MQELAIGRSAVVVEYSLHNPKVWGSRLDTHGTKRDKKLYLQLRLEPTLSVGHFKVHYYFDRL